MYLHTSSFLLPLKRIVLVVRAYLTPRVIDLSTRRERERELCVCFGMLFTPQVKRRRRKPGIMDHRLSIFVKNMAFSAPALRTGLRGLEGPPPPAPPPPLQRVALAASVYYYCWLRLCKRKSRLSSLFKQSPPPSKPRLGSRGDGGGGGVVACTILLLFVCTSPANNSTRGNGLSLPAAAAPSSRPSHSTLLPHAPRRRAPRLKSVELRALVVCGCCHCSCHGGYARELLRGGRHRDIVR